MFFNHWLPAITNDVNNGYALWYAYLLQGEDVVAGIRTPQPISALADTLPEAYAALVANCALLEKHYGDMQDIEFTVQEGRLFMLQVGAAAASLGFAKLLISVLQFVHDARVCRLWMHLSHFLHWLWFLALLQGWRPNWRAATLPACYLAIFIMHVRC